jgi:hypothetical protein
VVAALLVGELDGEAVRLCALAGGRSRRHRGVEEPFKAAPEIHVTFRVGAAAKPDDTNAMLRETGAGQAAETPLAPLIPAIVPARREERQEEEPDSFLGLVA